MHFREINTVGLIGLGVTGSPIAHKFYNYYGDDFCLIASPRIKEQLCEEKMHINGDAFKPAIISDAEEFGKTLDLIVICVKNYDLDEAIKDIDKCITKDTIILPLQNGIYSYNLFRSTFPDNYVMEAYVQGPNTQIRNHNITYVNSGTIHIGSNSNPKIARDVWKVLNNIGFPAEYETDIRHMVWKKWMLNVAGNSVTALTEADYSTFREIEGLVTLCRGAMAEFASVAEIEGVQLTEQDIDDVINYYISYRGSKKTSMLEDFMNHRRTENEYLAGYALELAARNNIKAPIIETLYRLIDIKEKIYIYD